jgi:hypothetical protein
MKFINITGKKETKGFEAGAVVVQTTSTKGDFRLSPGAAEKLGIVNGSFVVTVQDEESKVVYVAKGIAGTPVMDGDKQAVDKRGRKVFEEGTCLGALARPSAEGSLNLSFAATYAWQQVGGNEKEIVSFSLGEPVEDVIEHPVTGEEVPTLFYPLVPAGSKPKQERKNSKGENVPTDTDLPAADVPAGMQVETLEEGEVFEENEI